MKTVLFSPVGTSDPVRGEHDGAMMHILRKYRPDAVYLFLTREIRQLDEKDDRFTRTFDWIREHWDGYAPEVKRICADIEDPSDMDISGYSQQPAQAPKIEAAPLPADYVDRAEEVIRKLTAERQCITTSKIRNLLSLVSNIYNAENIRTGEEITQESVTDLTMMRIRTVYEAGRDQTVKDFVREAKLLEYMKDIGTNRQKLISFAHYMEALVAYHRFLGGKEN